MAKEFRRRRSQERFGEKKHMARGDHLYYYLAGGTYSHHGIDCGDGTVIHYDLTPWMKITGKIADYPEARVKRVSLKEFAQENQVLIRDYGGRFKLDDVDTAIERAEGRIGEDAYSVFGNNCEHFVVWCKTGVARSSQVDAHIDATKTVIMGAPIGAMLLRWARFAPGRWRGLATVGAFGAAGAVYIATYVRNRVKHAEAGLS